MNKDKRSVEILVISDTHLGTKGCRSRELLAYLKSVEPKTLILNGDIIDIWQFRKNYWPSSHMKILKYIIGLAARKTTVYYITGNHDEVMRRFNGTSIGNVHIVNQLIMEVGGEKTWFFHGDVFDVIMKNSKWLARLGSVSYDTLILINTIINRLSQSFGRGPVSLSKKSRIMLNQLLSISTILKLLLLSWLLEKAMKLLCAGIYTIRKYAQYMKLTKVLFI